MNTKKCFNCSEAINDNAKFCEYCGFKQPNIYIDKSSNENETLLDDLYSFINKSDLSVDKNELKQSLLLHDIIYEDNKDYNFHNSSMVHKFIDPNEIDNLQYPYLIKSYMNPLMENYGKVTNDTLYGAIEHMFYYLFLDKGVIKQNGCPTDSAINNRMANIFHCFPSDKIQNKIDIEELSKYTPQIKKYNNKHIVRKTDGSYYFDSSIIKELLINDFQINFNVFHVNNNFDKSLVKHNYADYAINMAKNISVEMAPITNELDYLNTLPIDDEYRHERTSYLIKEANKKAKMNEYINSQLDSWINRIYNLFPNIKIE